MKKETKCGKTKTLQAFILRIMLLAAIAVFAAGCGKSPGKEAASSAGDARNTAVAAEEGTIVGEGSTVFPLSVTDKDGNETQFEIHTDKETVGEALVELGLIAGDESEYGLYVKTVNGITADYDKDGVYWAFYINGEYASSGVDSTAITDGDSYAFKVE